MSIGVGLEVLQWLLLVLLTLTVVALAWLLRLLDQRISEGQGRGEPKRVQVGDAIQLPSAVADLASDPGRVLVLFASASCRSCARAYEDLQGAAAELQLSLITLWQDDLPEYAATDQRSVPRQLPAFEALKVGVTPFALMIEDGTVVVRGGVGSVQAREDYLARLHRANTNGVKPPLADQRRA